ncbi:MAG: hypothetical protein LIP12_09615 [Clostridiales bacterium]|nr:hypothetical protein [Clostridiales bacterium]
MKDGTFNVYSSIAETIGGTVKISDGTFKARGSKVIMLRASGGKITVSGGTFTGKKAYKYSQSDGGKVKITGGTFNVKYDEYES